MNITTALAWASGIFFYVFQYVVRVSPKVFLTDITTKFAISESIFGQFSGTYYLSYSLAHIPIGIILDRYDIKKVLPIFILLTTIGLLPIIWCDNFMYSILGRIITGIGSSAAILGLFKIARMCFEENKFSRIVSISVTIGLLGAIYAGEPLAILKDKIGFEAVIELIGIAGVVLSVLTYLMLPSSVQSKQEQTNTMSSILISVKQVFTNPKVVACFCLAGLMVGPLEGFADVWGPAFLEKVIGFDNGRANHISSLIFYGMIAGQTLIVLVAEKTQKYITVIAFAGVIMALTFVPMLFGMSDNYMLICAMMAICGGLCGYQMLAIYLGSTFVAENNRMLASALGNMTIMIFGYVFHTAIGSTLTFASNFITDEQLRWKVAIGTIPLGLLIGAIGFVMLGWKVNKASK